jgi:hypothetical protein
VPSVLLDREPGAGLDFHGHGEGGEHDGQVGPTLQKGFPAVTGNPLDVALASSHANDPEVRGEVQLRRPVPALAASRKTGLCLTWNPYGLRPIGCALAWRTEQSMTWENRFVRESEWT